MKNSPTWLLCRRLSRTSLGLCAAIALVLSLSTPLVTAAAAQSSKVKVKEVSGTATNTITSLVYNDDGTISLEAQQDGHLSGIGHFTGLFSYLAIPSPVSIVLIGTAELTTDNGDKLFFSAAILELGTDYPYTVGGTLTATGGTGKFEGVTGVLEVSGKDTAALTDTLKFAGGLVFTK